MSELRDAIAGMVWDEVPYRRNEENAALPRDVADAVLAVPELQAVRKALHLMAVKIAGEWGGEPGDSLREGEAFDSYRFTHVGDWSLPASVVAWVLDGEQ